MKQLQTFRINTERIFASICTIRMSSDRLTDSKDSSRVSSKEAPQRVR